MQSKIDWTRKAREDLPVICEHIAGNAPVPATASVRRLRQSINRLRNFHCSGRVVSEYGREEIHDFHQQPIHVEHGWSRSPCRVGGAALTLPQAQVALGVLKHDFDRPAAPRSRVTASPETYAGVASKSYDAPVIRDAQCDGRDDPRPPRPVLNNGELMRSMPRAALRTTSRRTIFTSCDSVGRQPHSLSLLHCHGDPRR